LKILVVGHLSIDVHHSESGPPLESFGGMVGVVQLLSSLAGKGDRIIPVCGVHADDREMFFGAIQSLPAIDTSCVFLQPRPTHRVHYYPREGRYGSACTKEVADPIPYSRFRELLNVDGILINMFSGFDITLETLDYIRMAIRQRGTPIHLDFHNLTLGAPQDGERARRPLLEWRRWAFMAETVQFNEEEIAGLTVERLTEQQTAGHLLTLGVKGVIVTRAERGATLYWNEKKHVQREDIVHTGSPAHGHGVGMGDLFGAAFHVQYLQNRNLIDALGAAHRIATTATQVSSQLQ
jgi:hypothetical protein